MEKKADVRYPLDLFRKYKDQNNYLVAELQEYVMDDKCVNKSCLDQQDIIAHLNTHMTRKNMKDNDEELYKKFQAFLNKLSHHNFDLTTKSILDLNTSINKKKHLYKLTEIIIMKSINENTYSSMYANLCVKLFTLNAEDISFRRCMLAVCCEVFEHVTNTRAVGKPYEFERSMDYNKLNINNYMKCLAELYNVSIINDSIWNQCYKILLSGVLNGKDYYDAFVNIINVKNMKTQEKEKIILDIKTLLKKTTFTFNSVEYNITLSNKNEFKLSDALLLLEKK